MRRPYIIGIALVGFVAGLSVIYLVNHSHDNTVQVSLVNQKTFETLPKKSASSAVTTRVGGEIIPPTNSWISGMVLQANPEPVYPMPLSFKADQTGFEIGQPIISSSATVISGGHIASVNATIVGAQDFKLDRFDGISATLDYNNGVSNIGDITISSGSPYVFYYSQRDSQLMVDGIVAVQGSSSNSYLRYRKNNHDYVIAGFDGATITNNGNTVTISLKKNSFVTFYSLPSSGMDNLRELAGNRVVSVDTTYSIDSNKATTILNYKTANQKPTAFAAMAYYNAVIDHPLATYDSVYGPMQVTNGNEFKQSAPTLSASNQLDLSHLTDAHKQQLIDNLKKDASIVTIDARDSYFAGKQLASAANLLDVASQLKQTDIVDQLKSKLDKAFTERLSSKYFYYDTKLKGIAAQTAAFGSEDFNDHHFHYGYFLYAASILGKYDSSFVSKYRLYVDLLAADIAGYETRADFPLHRNFDAYAGHSWAAGLSPFADGNNQESSSEAIQAWNGAALWGKLTKNSKLAESSEWMLAHETQTATKGWRNISTDALYLKNFKSPLTSLNFGGKRTYATFFSDESSTKLAIQLIPLNPMMRVFAFDGDAITRLVDASIAKDNFNVALGDYVLMYLALHDPHKAVKLAVSQQDNFIDNGNSRTYMNAWIFSQLDK